MKLLTHNFLSSRFLKEAKTGYPLVLRCTRKETVTGEFNEDFVKSMMSKIDYGALRSAADAIGEAGKLPESLPKDANEQYLPISADILEELYRVLFCVEVVDGELLCPDTGRIFPIKDGIPNMLCSETEVA